MNTHMIKETIIEKMNQILKIADDQTIRPSDKQGMVANIADEVKRSLEKTRTIGQAIDDLLLEHGRGSNGLYILEQAFVQSHMNAPHKHRHVATIDGMMAHQCPRRVKLMEEESAIIARLKAQGVL